MSETGKRLGILVLIVLCIACTLFYLVLSRRSKVFAASLSQPIRELSRATGKIGTEEAFPQLGVTNIEEIDLLADNFQKMSVELESRTKALIESQLRQRMQEKEAELAFTAGLFESASSYLHNIGNSLARMDGHIHDMKSHIHAMEQFPKIFSSIKESMPEISEQSSQNQPTMELLSRFEVFLESKFRLELETSMARIEEIRNHMAQSVKMQLEAFHDTIDKRSDFIQEFNVTSIVQYILEDFKPSLEKRKIALIVDLEPEVIIKNQKHPTIHGITNLIKNAIEAIELAGKSDEGRLTVSLKLISKPTRKMHLEVSDNGVGIAPEDMGFLFASGFTTKMGGHGLGLRSFNHFLKSNNGSITAKSAGKNCGITFTVEICDE